jgi:hypothetical protein
MAMVNSRKDRPNKFGVLEFVPEGGEATTGTKNVGRLQRSGHRGDPMPSPTRHEKVELAVIAIPIFELGDLNFQSVTSGDSGHTGVRFDTKHAPIPSRKHSRREPGTAAHIEDVNWCSRK